LIKENEKMTNEIATLCFVGDIGRGKRIYLGWTTDDLPTIADSQSSLVGRAYDEVELYKTVEMPVEELVFEDVKPVIHVSTAQAIDVKDHGMRKSEDIIVYKVSDQKGNKVNYPLGELSILEAIATVRKPWESLLGSELSGESVIESGSMFTLFITNKDDPTIATALLFKPLLIGGSNQASFRSFVRNTLGKLLEMDESQKPSERKGYIRVAGKYYKEGKDKTSFMDLFLTYESDEAREAALKKQRKKRAKTARTLRKLKIIQISDEDLELVENPLNDYDLDALSLKELVMMAREFYELAKRQIKK